MYYVEFKHVEYQSKIFNFKYQEIKLNHVVRRLPQSCFLMLRKSPLYCHNIALNGGIDLRLLLFTWVRYKGCIFCEVPDNANPFTSLVEDNM